MMRPKVRVNVEKLVKPTARQTLPTLRSVPRRRAGRPLDPAALQVAVRGLAERRLEHPDEVGRGHVGHGRETGDVERLRERSVHRVAGAQHPAVGVLGRRHGPRLVGGFARP